jgi:hypothetical protein
MAAENDASLGTDLADALARLEIASDSIDGHGLDDATVQRLLTAAVKAYCQTVELRDRAVDPFVTAPDGAIAVTATEAVATATEMLRAVEVEPFELGMWWSRGSLYRKDMTTEGQPAR